MTGRARRPAYHFAPRKGWINDPLGVTYRGGTYDVFYQYVPGATTWQPACQWGHAVSADLVTFAEQSAALTPGDGDAGCWSGCVVAEHDLMLFTSVTPPDLSIGRVRCARPRDPAWREWAKGSYVVDVPAGTGAAAFRDPSVWWDNDVWRMLVGAALPGRTAAALTFTSPDLQQWTYSGVFAERSSSERNGAWTGSLWECPQLVRIDGEDVLLVSVWDDDALQYVACARGVCSGGRFAAQAWQQLTFGAYYAATSFCDDEGKPALLQWLRGVGDPAAGWCGALSIPQRLSIREGRVLAAPHPRVAAARAREVMSVRPVAAGEPVALPSWHCEVVLRPRHDTDVVRLAFSSQRNGSDPAVTLTLDWEQAQFSLAAPDAEDDVSGPLDQRRSEVTLLLDGCLAEAYLGRSGVVAVPIRPATAVIGWLRVASSGGRADDDPLVGVWDLTREPRAD
ncbi:MAG: glycoside hydrolase family 32 protein [Nocardioidaceae bacterium]